MTTSLGKVGHAVERSRSVLWRLLAAGACLIVFASCGSSEFKVSEFNWSLSPRDYLNKLSGDSVRETPEAKQILDRWLTDEAVDLTGGATKSFTVPAGDGRDTPITVDIFVMTGGVNGLNSMEGKLQLEVLGEDDDAVLPDPEAAEAFGATSSESSFGNTKILRLTETGPGGAPLSSMWLARPGPELLFVARQTGGDGTNASAVLEALLQAAPRSEKKE